jgi:hypothetical protein
MSDDKHKIKPITADGVEAALRKAEHYRVLNEPISAESICIDVLTVVPGNVVATRLQVLAITDQFITGHGVDFKRAEAVASELEDAYTKAYLFGMICERWAKGVLRRTSPGAGEMAYEFLEKAHGWYAKAEAIRPAGNDDAILRWNSCVRLRERNPHVAPRPPEQYEPMLE